ncbi:MAG: hypothetical protein AAF611_14545 [Bacteroidota bacterium]
MNLIKTYFLLLFLVISFDGNAQKSAIEFELNGRNATATSQNPFAKFIGEWTLKNDDWTHNWGNGTETIKIPNHHTICNEINTNNSLLAIIDGPEPNGHIFWSYNPNTKEVSHLSSFGSIRAGKGNGTINDNGDVTLKLSFEGEAEGTYRIYNYKWLNANAYHMKSVQYDKNDQPTGLFYEGTFVRIESTKNQKIKQEIEAILKILDNNEISVEEQLNVYSESIVHMAPNTAAITDKEALKTYLETQRTYGTSKMQHAIIDFEILGDKILMRGEVKGIFYPTNNDTPTIFKTKNMFLFQRENGVLKIAKIIYNMTRVE